MNVFFGKFVTLKMNLSNGMIEKSKFERGVIGKGLKEVTLVNSIFYLDGSTSNIQSSGLIVRTVRRRHQFFISHLKWKPSLQVILFGGSVV